MLGIGVSMLKTIKRLFSKKPQTPFMSETETLMYIRRAFAGELPIQLETAPLGGTGKVLTIAPTPGHKIIIGSVGMAGHTNSKLS